MKSDKEELRSKLIDLYKKLLLKPKSKENIMNLYVEYLELINMYDYALPTFKYFQSGTMAGNCYTYALDLKCPIIFQELYWLFSLFKEELNLNVGFISAVNNRCTVSVTSEKELLENLYADLEFLKIRVFESGINKGPTHGGYKIYVYKDTLIHSNGDFHFVRRNYDGTLSHKNGYNGNIKRIKCLRDVDKKYELVRTLEIVKPNFR